ncbi:PREDICTED: uncharacterized protein LOC108747869 isoform X1 [Trachymyrmex septentrionalis]|uniref:uncharacterized protein LOC108747869 isoform X1 n=2 Tax=Trachymyrmex septentrionalis TaxID=34720 RepID=UPI00084EDC24|nr:PREDICTED: uncharacterized protein LOC108747869 isoform X1 [Trachymyrmex septentrionalis]XP_018341256.1 PREDICTED: uncharacterized protein LOC108747869 isoform X1 [Trachymyrmex septentrionalis]
MEIMEDGNLVDRVRILLQRDMEYYQEMQTVLREPLCIRISGGRLDFPRHASFAAIKIVTWWEADFMAAFKRPSGLSSSGNESLSSVDSEDGVIKRIQPSDFIMLVVDTAEQLLEHLHMLIQESLDHADLTVLTATLGAAALIRNCLWCYNQHAKGTISSQSSEKINKSHKAFHEMAEAVAERLLDLHCRLISLYILNEADSLSWHSNKPFFERERCSYVIQMWWLYMQGTKADLWNTVSPKMAQRVFSEMLNESLSIITTRFIHGRPTLARFEQFWSDAFNALCCTGYLALGACVDSDGMIGVRPNNLPTAIRDIHAKCNELLICLLLRGTPLKELYQVFRHGLENLAILRPRRGPAPWLLICAPNLLGLDAINSPADIITLSEDKAVILELNVLRHQPQPNWPQLMKVISMSNYVVAKMLLKTLVRQNVGVTCVDDSDAAEKSKTGERSCSGFLCSNSACDKTLKITSALVLYSLFHILVVTVNEPEHVIIPALKQDPNWSNYLDRQQVWNQSRPPWLNALIKPLKIMMQPVTEALLEAAKTGASIYQAMSLAIGCFAELYVTSSTPVLRAAFALNDNIPAHCRPIGGNVLLQVLCAALYSTLLDMSAKSKNEPHDTPSSGDTYCELSPFNPYDRSTAATALAEAICSIDEDNKHTSQIDSFLLLVKDSLRREHQNPRNGELQNMACVIETYTDELLFTNIGRRSLKIAYEYLVRASDWVLSNLRRSEESRQVDLINLPEVSPIVKPLTHIMFHIEDTWFDQFMTNYEATNWSRILTMPLSITLERVRSQVLLRPEFKNIGDLSHEDKEVAQSIKRICSFVRSARFK